jgi:hypothetical protein
MRYVGSYGNERKYVVAWLYRDGFERLARSVEAGKPSARFAKELARTTPSEYLDAITDIAERFGPRRPEGWRGCKEEFALADWVRENPS